MSSARSGRPVRVVERKSKKSSDGVIQRTSKFFRRHRATYQPYEHIQLSAPCNLYNAPYRVLPLRGGLP
jgi:hypothetical protein